MTMRFARRVRGLPRWVVPALLLALLAIVLVACIGEPGPTLAPGVTPGPTPRPTPVPPLVPAEPKADPVGILAWLFTPIFQALFLLLVALDQVAPDVGVAIILMTLVVRSLLVPLMRRQMVSTRRLQGIQPEVKEIQRRYKGDPKRTQEATMALYKERGISQAGCLMMLLPLLIIIPMYTVIDQGLKTPDPHAMLRVFGIQLIDLTCAGGLDAIGNPAPCIESTIPWLGGVPAYKPSIDFRIPVIGFGMSFMAIIYTLISLVASRLSLPPHDPGKPLDQAARTQRTTMLIVPLISLFYSEIIPVGLFLYLIASTVYQIVQQFLTTGWGSMFPIFGWMPAFAVDHKPRFPVAVPTAPPSHDRPAGAPAKSGPERSVDRAASAAATIRPKGRTSRRGRRR